MSLTVLILALVTLERLAELPWAEANRRRLIAAGGHEVRAGHYPTIVLVHALWLAALWWLAPGRPVSLPLLGLFGLVELGRLWVLTTLGRRWTTRIIIVPGETLVRRGPYHFLAHPNYLVVFLEIALLPLVFGLWEVALVFSLLNALLLRPLPYPEPERLVMVWQDLRARGGPATEWPGPSQHVDWKAETAVFENLTSMRGWNASLSGGAFAEAVLGEQTTYEYFDVLGVRPALGRGFRDSDDVPNAPRVVVLSHRLWTQRFGADRSIVGRAVPINGESHEVIGVMPPSFTPGLVTNAALWRPMRMNRVNPSRNSAVNRTIGKLQSGVSIEQARTGLAALAKRLELAHPESDTGKGINPVPLQEQRVGNLRPALVMLLRGSRARAAGSRKTDSSVDRSIGYRRSERS